MLRSYLRAVRVQLPFVFSLSSRPIVHHVQASYIYRTCCSYHSCFVVLLIRTLFLSKHTSRPSHCSRGNLVAFNPNSWSVGGPHPKCRPTFDAFALCRPFRLAAFPPPCCTSMARSSSGMAQLRLILWNGVDHFGVDTVSFSTVRLEHYYGKATASV
jgi:hypothetical protein